MSTINFNLKNPKSNSKTVIYLIFRWNENKVKVSTRLSINPKDWNFKNQRIKKGKLLSKSYNGVLDKFEIVCTTLILKYEHKLSSITPDVVKSELFGTPIIENSKQSLTDYMEKYIYRKKNILSSSTINSYSNTLNKLKTFLTETELDDNFEVVDLIFYDQLVEFLFAPPYQFSINTVGKHIKNLKAVLNSAVSDGKCKNLKFKQKAFKKPKQKTTHIYLTLTELAAIKNTRYPTERLTQAAHLLLILSFTGVRFIDLYKVSTKSLRVIDSPTEAIKILEILTSKTRKVVTIPCHPYVIEILDTYGFHLPRYSNQKLNLYIKEVAELAGINTMVSEISSVGGKPVVYNKPKYHFVCTHTGRRSLITNLYLSKIDNRSIQRLSGHVTEIELSKYVGINDLDNTISLAKHPFFRNNRN